MKTSDFRYDLPEGLIADHPLSERDRCSLLCMDRREGSVVHRTFHDIAGILTPGDRLVLNNSKVIPARLYCMTENSGRVELLFTEKIDSLHWRAIGRPGKKLRPGRLLIHNETGSEFRVTDILDNSDRVVRLENAPYDSLEEALEDIGRMPLPPYIKREADEGDREDYQTVFGIEKGSVAAPTAGLHFTERLLEQIAASGIGVTYLTLHVGVGTFRPVKEDIPEEHTMHTEEFHVSEEAASEINDTVDKGGRIIAAGTTVVRTLEHLGQNYGGVVPGHGSTDIMILPGHEFRIVQGLITNFHLPESTLLMLVSAFGGYNNVMDAYRTAIDKGYRFYSYGDAMFIIS